jgi:maleate isomerase
VVSIGVLTPHLATGPQEEFAAMAAGQVTTRVVRVSADVPTTASSLRDLVGSALDEAARSFAVESADVVGYASTSTGYALGFDAEAAMASRLSDAIGTPVASTCASAVSALRVLDVERIALIEPRGSEPGSTSWASRTSTASDSTLFCRSRPSSRRTRA